MKRTLLLFALLLTTVSSWAQKTKVVITTEYGKIALVLFDKTPKHRDNMIKLIKEHFYDSTLFHRVIPQFVIQGGDPNSKHAAGGQQLGEGDLGYKVPAEFVSEYYHQYGALAMARDNNPDKSSSACQFYIVTGKKYTAGALDTLAQKMKHTFTEEQKKTYETVGGTPFLDGNYTVFGQVTEGMDIVEKIANVDRDFSDRPSKDVRMISVKIVKSKRFLFF